MLCSELADSYSDNPLLAQKATLTLKLKAFRLLMLLSTWLLTSCSGVLYYPSQNRLYYDPKSVGFSPTDIYFTDATQRKLHGWWFRSAITPAKATVIFFHGNAENLTSHFMHLAWITAEGYNLFIFDYPGYGLSEGKPTPQSCVESGHAALDWVLSHDPENLPMIIYGQSMGGIIALRTIIDKREDINLKLVVAESTFDSFQQIARHKLSQHWFTWLLQPLSYLLLSDRWAPTHLETIAPVPVLVIHGQQDNVVEPQFGEAIYEKLSEPKSIWRIPNGNHTDIFWQHEKKYRTVFLNFLTQLDLNQSVRKNN